MLVSSHDSEHNKQIASANKLERNKLQYDIDVDFARELTQTMRKENERREAEAIEMEERASLRYATNAVNKANNIVSEMARALYAVIYFLEITNKYVKDFLIGAPLISVALVLLSAMLKGTVAILSSDESKWLRAVKFATAIAAIAVTIIGFTVITESVAVVLVILSTAIDLVHNTCEMINLIYKRFTGEQKENRKIIVDEKKQLMDKYEEYKSLQSTIEHETDPTKLTELKLKSAQYESNMLQLHRDITARKNRQKENDCKLVNKIHAVVICTVAMAGSIMLLTPLAPIGAALLIGVAVYNLIERLNLNPLKYLANKITGNPLNQKNPAADFNELKKKLDKKIERKEEKALSQLPYKKPTPPTTTDAHVYQKLSETSLQKNGDTISAEQSKTLSPMENANNNTKTQTSRNSSIWSSLMEPSENVEETFFLLRMR